MKKPFYTELAYFAGLILLAIGTALMTRADFGLSMVVAPAYLIHLKISESLPSFTFGTAEYALQAVLILTLILIRKKIRLFYLCSFITAVLYGFALDGMLALIGWVTMTMPVRIAFYLVGMVLCSAGVSLYFHTYFSPAAYELFVKDLSGKFNVPINRFKTIYDCTSCGVAIILSFLFFGFGHFKGIGWGTVVCALLNGWIIGRMTKLFESRFEFVDRLTWRKLFEN